MIVNEEEGKVYLTPQEVVDYNINPTLCKTRESVYFAIKFNFLKAKKTEKGYLVEFDLDDEIRQKIQKINSKSAKEKKQKKYSKVSISGHLYKLLYMNADGRGMDINEYINDLFEKLNKHLDFFVPTEEGKLEKTNKYTIKINSNTFKEMVAKLRKLPRLKKPYKNLMAILTVIAIIETIDLSRKQIKEVYYENGNCRTSN